MRISEWTGSLSPPPGFNREIKPTIRFMMTLPSFCELTPRWAANGLVRIAHRGII